MKKILLTTAACAVLAASPAFAAEGDFYVKADAGWSKMDKQGDFKSNNDAYVGVGVGYSVMDNVRVDLTYNHFVNPQFKSKPFVAYDLKAGSKKEYKIKSKMNIDTLLFNSYFDLFDVSVAKFHIGGGIGASRIGSKVTGEKKSLTTGITESVSGKAKPKTYFAYALYAGTSMEVAPGIHAEISYSFRNLGKEVGTLDKGLQAHNVGAGVRFEI